MWRETINYHEATWKREKMFHERRANWCKSEQIIWEIETTLSVDKE